ncbi:hypothetical protein B0H13DRAFT_2311320 [Mycena leptocephala]|nr:hypothetical protein B0H13DRAFT_2311320 [Mycena leptocephala]
MALAQWLLWGTLETPSAQLSNPSRACPLTPPLQTSANPFARCLSVSTLVPTVLISRTRRSYDTTCPTPLQ